MRLGWLALLGATSLVVPVLAIPLTSALSAVAADPSPLPSALPSASPSPAVFHKLLDMDPQAKQGYYSQRILKFLEPWPPATLTISNTDRTIYTRAIRTAERPKIVGMVKHFNLQAPFERVIKTVEDFEGYSSIWEGVVSVKVSQRDGNRLVTDWVRKAPTFFMPRMHYRLLYIVDATRPGKTIYRSQLIDGNALSESDGLVVVEKLSDAETRISVVNFFDPDAGPFRSLVEGVIWKRALMNSFKDDVAFRAKAEHPDWDLDRVTEESEKAWKETPLDPILYTDVLKFN